MKSGNISVLVGTVAAIATAVVDPQPTQMRLGAVAASALDGAVDLVTVLIDPQAGKVCVLRDSDHANIRTALIGATGNGDITELVASGATKAKSFTTAQITLTAPQAIDGADVSTEVANAIAAALLLPPVPTATLSSAISALEDHLVNVDSPIPIVIMVCQATQAITVVQYDTAAHAAAAYALGAAASVKQAEFQSTAPTSGTTGAQFFE